MRHAIVALSDRGVGIARQLGERLPETDIFLLSKLAEESPEQEAVPFDNLRELTGRLFASHPAIVFIMPLGIVVRVVAPYAKDKHTDPAVVVVDEGGRFAVSLLSGHEGGANLLALRVANATGAEPVITSAAESGKKVVVGLGARKGISPEAVSQAIEGALLAAGRSMAQVRWVATIENKADEPGVVAACASLGLPLRVFGKERIARFQGSYQRSGFVKDKIGVEGVCEPCVLLSGKDMELVLLKTVSPGVTVAVGEDISI